MKSHNREKIHFIVMQFLLKPKLVACNDLIPTSKHCSTLCKLRERARVAFQHFGHYNTPQTQNLLIFSKKHLVFCTRQECRVVNYEISWGQVCNVVALEKP
jgi:hypothetical protein